MKRVCWALCLLLVAVPAWAQVVSRELDEGWRFRLLPGDAQAKSHPEATAWRKASVPGSVHTDLLAHGVIADPYVGAAEAALQWIGLADWEYVTRFDVDEATLARPHAELVFEGVDTLAEMSLNGKPLLNTDNSHRTWRVRVDRRLKARKNELRIVFRSPIRALLPQVQAMPHKIAGNYPSPYGDEPKDAMVGNFVRKPGYHFGWDWGPRYVTAGLWRPVTLETWKALRVTDMAVATRSLDQDEADLDIIAVIDSAGPDTAAMEVEILDPDGQRVGILQRSALLVPGENRFELTTTLRDPRRWWPAGYGEQARYRFRLSVRNARGDSVAAERLTGLRSVELRRDRDSEGQGFAFVINGVPIFAKGANVIPFDAFPARVDRGRLRTVLQAARDANMNMLRNWGGGYYESDDFYDIADELGLLIWQDFMFGGGMQPAYEPLFRANVVAEARDNIRRLRHHPSIVLWCGNNEEETAWKDWGHRKQLTEADPVFAERVWQGYLALFGRDLRRVVHEESLGVPYWSSSPSNDLDEKANDSRKGDKHYWDVWAGSKPVQAYLQETPRFMSEFGLQAWPVQATVDSFATRAEQSIDGPVIRAHQKFLAGAGNERLLLYIENEYGTPRNFADFIYLSQVMQAEGIELAALHHRASRPYTMGSLYWQLNDVWPGASWSSIDYAGRWKALHFHARRFFAEVAIAASRQEGETRLALVSDRQTAIKAEWRVRVLDFSGKELRQRKGSVTLPPLSATQVRSFKDSELLRGADPTACVAVFELYEGQNRIARQLLYFDAAKALKLPPAAIQTDLERVGDGYRLHLQSAQLVRALWIDAGQADAVVSDNALDLLPGEAVTVAITSKASLTALRASLQLKSLADVLPSPAPHSEP
ncbi:MAG TPA: glycoside hydrolase family 2 protein [Pseudoxanthomonas sp.]|nr:glycoside hydrolase family 2 protein [Pseudoxanthomonas sp.]